MGNIGINSSLTVDTAQEAEAGRGKTYTAVHASEVAFWPDIETKLLGLLSPSRTTRTRWSILESTANGNNFFRDLWDDAVDGTQRLRPVLRPVARGPDLRGRSSTTGTARTSSPRSAQAPTARRSPS
jgi:hypothetical protein